MDYDAILYGPIYSTLGVPAQLLPRGMAEPIDVTVIDKTVGEDVSESNDVNVQTIKPVAAVRASELAEKGISPTWLDGGLIEFNGFTFDITSYLAKPAPTGESKGEFYLILQGQAPEEPTEGSTI